MVTGGVKFSSQSHTADGEKISRFEFPPHETKIKKIKSKKFFRIFFSPFFQIISHNLSIAKKNGIIATHRKIFS
jgi:hypothetical protein